MGISLGSRTKAARRRHAGVLTVIAAALTLAACGPATPPSAPSTSATPAASTTTAVTPTTTTPSPTETPTPSPSPTTEAPSPSPTTKAPVRSTTKPAPAPPAPTRTRTPAPEPTTAAAADCYPLSNAGNCYRAGQICRKADIGTSGRDARGRAIYCRQDDSVGQRWGY
ncbi:hypothetical protein ACF09L_02370 [Streptomyces sp. NPDC014779]|uniref:hypothetical protein n=1 Tax=Streptomyces sp. NPDC014779 TaxID=3364911 RepID=UPI0037011EC7